MAFTDRDALAALFRSAGGPNWKRKRNWDTAAELSQWDGVGVNGQGRVVSLDLSNSNLQGPIPPELGNVTALQRLDLEGSGLSGPIPPELGKLGALTWLNLSGNQLSGHIPPQLGDLGALEHLHLAKNKLDGPIPSELGALSKLEVLRLTDNKLTGQIPKELGALSKLQKLLLDFNQLLGPIPRELGDLVDLTHLDLSDNAIVDAPTGLLTGGALTRWLEKLRGAGGTEPLAIVIVDFLVALWHFLIPIFDDVTDVILLVATFGDRGGLWWACYCAFVLADVERLLLFIVTLLLVVCWIPFALLGTDESRGGRFKVVLRVLNGGHELRLETVRVRITRNGAPVWGVRGSALRWPVMDGFLWVVVGSRSKSSSLMRLCGLEGRTPVDVLEHSGFGLSLIDRIVDHHPYSRLARALFSYPHGHHLPDSGAATRRSWVMLRAVGETLVVDSLFLALSLSTETWEDGVSIGIFSLIFSVLELLTELQYYAAEARADMVTDGEKRTDAEMADRDSIEVVDRAPPV